MKQPQDRKKTKERNALPPSPTSRHRRGGRWLQLALLAQAAQLAACASQMDGVRVRRPPPTALGHASTRAQLMQAVPESPWRSLPRDQQELSQEILEHLFQRAERAINPANAAQGKTAAEQVPELTERIREAVHRRAKTVGADRGMIKTDVLRDVCPLWPFCT